jgi:transcription elongation factor Elf1
MPMPSPSTSRFNCPRCGTPYTLIRVEADPTPDEAEIACTVCSAPLPAREGEFILKYFLLRRNSSRQDARYTVL